MNLFDHKHAETQIPWNDRQVSQWFSNSMLGCMAERLKKKLLESDAAVDIVAGPDAYRSLPHLISAASQGHPSINTLLSVDETYADIRPVRTDGKPVAHGMGGVVHCPYQLALTAMVKKHNTQRPTHNFQLTRHNINRLFTTCTRTSQLTTHDR
jgi:hypothetical protein